MSAQTNLIRAALEYGQEARPRSPLFNRALAALSELEAQTPIDWKGIKVTKGQETHPLGTLIELLEHERDTAIAELEAHSSEPRLTVEQAVEVTKRWIFSASNTDIDDPEWKDDKWIAASKDLRDRLTKAAQ